MIDIGSSDDILYFNAFQKLRFSTNKLTPMGSSLMGFMDNSISPLGAMSLHITFENELCSKIILSTYNTIIGRLMLNKLWAMVLTYYMIKFSISTINRELRSNSR